MEPISFALTQPSPGYSFPNVDFDLPDDPNGIQATGSCAVRRAPDRLYAGRGGQHGNRDRHPSRSAGLRVHLGAWLAVFDGTQFNPVTHNTPGWTMATGTATLQIASIVVDTPGTGYTSTPTVAIADTPPQGFASGHGAVATAQTDQGAISGLTLTNAGGSGYVTGPGIKKFQDTLPVLGTDPNTAVQDELGQCLPVAQPDTKTFANADYYVIGLVQHRERMSSSLPAAGTLLREYVQLSTAVVPGKKVALGNDLLERQVDAGAHAGRLAGLRRGRPALPRPDHRRPRTGRFGSSSTTCCQPGRPGDLFLPTDSS